MAQRAASPRRRSWAPDSEGSRPHAGSRAPPSGSPSSTAATITSSSRCSTRSRRRPSRRPTSPTRSARSCATRRNADVLLAEVVSIDPAGGRSPWRDGATLSYDTLIVAAGARHAYFGHEEWEARAPGPQDPRGRARDPPPHPARLRGGRARGGPGRRKSLLTFAIVGGGPTGVELAGAIAEIADHVLVDDFRHIDPREARIVLVEAGPRILPSYSPKTSENAAAELRRLGVEVRTGRRSPAVDATGSSPADRHLDAGTVVWAAGVAASRVGSFLGAPLDRTGRVVVEPGPLRPRTSRGLRDRRPRPLHAPGRPAAAGRQPGRHAAGPLRGARDPDAPRRPRGAAVPLLRQGHPGRHRAAPPRSPRSSG